VGIGDRLLLCGRQRNGWGVRCQGSYDGRVVDDPEQVRSRFDSDDEYREAVRERPWLWTPLMRRALEVAGLPSSGRLEMLGPGQYPTARGVGLGVVVSVYPEHWDGRAAWKLEREAHAVVDGSGLPVPRLVGYGELFPDADRYSWPWLIEADAAGAPWAQALELMPPRAGADAAAQLGSALRRLHDHPCGNGPLLGAGWGRFLALVSDERDRLGENDDRLQALPASLHEPLRELAAATLEQVDSGSIPQLLHGDVRASNLLIDPESGVLTMIDLNEMNAGLGWYDLADAAFRLFHGDPRCIAAMLDAYRLPAHYSDGDVALRLLGWALLHDFDGITSATHGRHITASSVRDLACQLTGV
jgi:hygromycin-B 7''-O-kinase